MTSQAMNELEAIKVIHGALEPLEEEARTRVLAYITSLLGIDAVGSGRAGGRGSKTIGEEEVETAGNAAPAFSTFAELYDAAGPTTNSEKALVVGYWLQVILEADNFTAAKANKELKNLGHQVANITAAIDDLKNQKPALALQLRKSGTSRQARKTYKITHAGMERVKEMLGG